MHAGSRDWGRARNRRMTERARDATFVTTPGEAGEILLMTQIRLTALPAG
jgi:hypothetical protein